MGRMVVVGMLVVALVMALVGCSVGGGDGGGGTPEAPRTGMQAIEANEAAGATPDCGRYPVWMECRK